jgi:NADH-quinone oxidoreductase subunit E
MQFSEKFEKRFAEWLTHYPVKRSVLVPSLLYVQDELGHLTEEAIAEIASRLDLTVLEVNNVISYYSLLTRKPKGKFNVQVCTNICCMLRGAEEVFDAARRTLGIGHKQVTPDGQFSLEEVECIGACSWGPAMQVNYDYHENMSPETTERILDEYRKKDTQ